MDEDVMSIAAPESTDWVRGVLQGATCALPCDLRHCFSQRERANTHVSYCVHAVASHTLNNDQHPVIKPILMKANMATVLQATFSKACSAMKIFVAGHNYWV